MKEIDFTREQFSYDNIRRLLKTVMENCNQIILQKDDAYNELDDKYRMVQHNLQKVLDENNHLADRYNKILDENRELKNKTNKVSETPRQRWKF